MLIVNIFILQLSPDKWSINMLIVFALLAFSLSKHYNEKPAAYSKHVHSVSKISSLHSKTL